MRHELNRITADAPSGGTQIKSTGVIAPLTGLRAIAAYSVLFSHLATLTFPGVSIQPLAARIAYFGISLFFVLSGFVIQYNYGHSVAFGGWRGAYNFFVARFARLYPLYAAMLAIGFSIAGGIPYLNRPDIVLSHLTLTQSWIGSFRAYFPVTWTISTEWFFYLLFIPLCRLFAVCGDRGVLWSP